MQKIDAATQITRLVRALELIVEQWPEISASDLLQCARALPAIMADNPCRILLNDRAARLYLDDLVDADILPPWVGSGLRGDHGRSLAL